MPKANPALPPNSQLYQQLSPGAFFGMKENQEQGPGLGMTNTTPVSEMLGKDGMRKGYEHFDLSQIDKMSRSTWKYDWATALDEKLETGNPGWESNRIYDLCFCISYIYRHGRRSIRKYFNLRDIYCDHLPFEVGYMTHVIMTKYQNMLELYEYSASLKNFKPDAKKNKKPGSRIKNVHLAGFRDSVVKDSLTVQHLCNMLHELKAKYAAKPYNRYNRFEIDPSNRTSDESEEAGGKREGDEEDKREGVEKEEVGTGKSPKINEAYLAKKVKQSQKLINEALEKRKKQLQEQREFYSKHGYHSTTSRTQQPMRLWSPNLDYGWSGEEDW